MEIPKIRRMKEKTQNHEQNPEHGKHHKKCKRRRKNRKHIVIEKQQRDCCTCGANGNQNILCKERGIDSVGSAERSTRL